MNELKSLHVQYDCYLQLGLLMLMIKSFVVRFNFIFMMFSFWVSVLKFGMSPTLTVAYCLNDIRLYLNEIAWSLLVGWAVSYSYRARAYSFIKRR